MRFWDSSAVVPLLVRQPESTTVTALIEQDPEMIVSWSTSLECASALARLRREGRIDVTAESVVLATLRELQQEWSEVMPVEQVRSTALRVLRTHPLRAAEALQLASALAWSPEPRGDAFVTLDARLAMAATLEGFTVIPGGPASGQAFPASRSTYMGIVLPEG